MKGIRGLKRKVLQSEAALRPLYDIQVRRFGLPISSLAFTVYTCYRIAWVMIELFNLKLLDGSLNILKGAMFHSWLEARREGHGADGCLDLYRGFLKSKVCRAVVVVLLAIALHASANAGI